MSASERKATLAKAWQLGREARDANRGNDANPYKAMASRAAFYDGWVERDREMRGPDKSVAPSRFIPATGCADEEDISSSVQENTLLVGEEVLMGEFVTDAELTQAIVAAELIQAMSIVRPESRRAKALKQSSSHRTLIANQRTPWNKIPTEGVR